MLQNKACINVIEMLATTLETSPVNTGDITIRYLPPHG